MEKSSLIGIVLAFISIGVGMVLKGASLVALLNPAAALIIFGGTASALFIAFSMAEMKKIPSLMKIIFTEQKLMPKKELIETFIEWVSITRREGLLSLEKQAEELSDPFMKSGMRLIIDGNDADFVRDVLLEDIAEMETLMIVEGLLSIQSGVSANSVKQKMLIFIANNERASYDEDSKEAASQ
ncbi:motility-associated protein [Paenibacillus sp. TAF58]